MPSKIYLPITIRNKNGFFSAQVGSVGLFVNILDVEKI